MFWFQTFSDKSRDYTVLDPSLHATQAPATAWQNTQAASMYVGGAPGSQVPGGQMSPWNPTQQEVSPSYLSAPGTYPGQGVPPVPGYSPAAGSPLAQSNPIAHNASPPAPGSSPHVPSSSYTSASPPGTQPYYG